MRQVLQSYKTGELCLAEVPIPAVKRDHILVCTAASLVSVGTEKYMLELARKSLVGKALARPDLVRQVIAKAQAEGILEAWRQAMGRLDTPVPLGYSSAGVVIDVGPGVEGFAVGNRVACAGSGYAGHTEVASVPANLCVKIPPRKGQGDKETRRQGDSPPHLVTPSPPHLVFVSFDEAAFVALGGIALEAVRMARVSLGETVVVIGLGLLGQIAVQLLNAAGCHVIGMDINSQKAEMALQHGAEAVATDYPMLSAICRQRTANHGADAVIILAATPSNEPLEWAAELCRERGRIVAAGLVGLEIPRKAFYDKELELVVSRAWGPGLYDPHYTEKGLDYPLAYARWTAKRNMEEFLAQLAKGTVQVKHLITHRFPFERALEAYELILEGKEPYIGVLLEYGRWKGEEGRGNREEGTGKGEGGKGRTEDREGKRGDGLSVNLEPLTDRKVWLRKPTTDGAPRPDQSSRSILHRPSSIIQSPISVGLIGAGQYARGTLLPALQKVKGVRYIGVATATGLSGRHVGDKYGFEYCTTDYGELLEDEDVKAVFVLTRHGLHARFASEALRAGKAVFVEKPLALNEEQLSAIVRAYWQTADPSVAKPADGEIEASNPQLVLSPVEVSAIRNPPFLMVGFNRRFAPTTRFVQQHLRGGTGPLVAHCRCNAGYIPPDSWVHDPKQGGGRIIGEVCHFVDLIQALTGGLPVEVYVAAAGGSHADLHDNITISLKLDNGSVGSIVYTAGGDKSFPREYVDVFGHGAVATIDNFKSASFTQAGRTSRKRGWFSVDRGHVNELTTFFRHLREGRPQPVPMREYVATTLATFAMERSIREGKPVKVDVDSFVRECEVE